MWRNKQLKYTKEHEAPDFARALYKAEQSRSKNRQKRKKKLK